MSAYMFCPFKIFCPFKKILGEQGQQWRAPYLNLPELARLRRPGLAFGGAESSPVNTASAHRVWALVG